MSGSGRALSGETDFPCIYDDRVGLGRTYAKLDRLTFDGWLDAFRDGRSYVSDGLSHLMDFAVNGVARRHRRRDVRDGTRPCDGERRVAPRRDAEPVTRDARRGSEAVSGTSSGRGCRHTRRQDRVHRQRPAGRDAHADGRRHDSPRGSRPAAARSGWVAARILPSSHTNPIWVQVGGQPMRPPARAPAGPRRRSSSAGGRSSDQIKPEERAAAAAAYDRARAVYRRLLDEGIE